MKKNNLPNEIAIFPLSNAIFFPRTILPLNIFEDRYIQLINDCMKNNRMFGMVQPKNNKEKVPEVYGIGCLGKIISFNETLDKRLKVNKYLAIEYSIADIATWPWIARFEIHQINLENYPYVHKWYKIISKRSAVIRGYNILGEKIKIPMI